MHRDFVQLAYCQIPGSEITGGMHRKFVRLADCQVYGRYLAVPGWLPGTQNLNLTKLTGSKLWE